MTFLFLLRRSVFVVTVFVCALLPRLAYADEATAREHFKKGVDLYDKRQYSAALSAFEDAYKEKPSAGIKQNIALCLKGLNRPADAATAFDEALDEGKATLKPDTRAAIDRELAELTKVVATVNVAVVAEDKTPIDGAVLSVAAANEAPRLLPANAHKRPIRLMPGVYTFGVHVTGYPDPPEKHLALVSGAPVDVTFTMTGKGTPNAGIPGQQGMLTIRASRPDATIKVDDIEVGKETWTGPVAAGTHHIEVVGAAGWKTTTADVSVGAGVTVDYPVTVLAATEVPAEYYAPTTKLKRRKRLYIAADLGLDGASYHLSHAMDEGPGGHRQGGFGGLSTGGRFGVAFAPLLAVELLGEVGLEEQKNTATTRPGDTDTKLFHWQLTPVLRFTSKGPFRFTSGVGLGIHGVTVSEKEPANGKTQPEITRHAVGTAPSWLFDVGGQFDVGPIFLEAVLFLDVHEVKPVRDDDPPHDRFLLGSPAVRGGIRLALGVPFL